MRIAQVAPLAERVPPERYGGTERVVSWLTEELVRQGHEVTLFACDGSKTGARLVSCAPGPTREGRLSVVEAAALQTCMVERVVERASEFDVVHFHVDVTHLPVVAREAVPALTTLHGRLDLPCLAGCYRRFRHLPFVSISDAQRAPMPWLRWHATVHHGIPSDLFDATLSSEGYLLFLGRISPEKRCDRAIEIATRAGKELVIAAKIDSADRDYFEHIIRPLLRRPGVRFVGEVGDPEKRRLLAGADALLFPIDWPEPFGLVMIEALASGTPVIAWPLGAVPEVIEDGVSGYLVSSIDEAVSAVGRLPALSRRRCRQELERRFTPRHMADNYLRAYRALLRWEPADDFARAEPRGDGGRDRRLPGAAGL